jgi:hypothetical protein
MNNVNKDITRATNTEEINGVLMKETTGVGLQQALKGIEVIVDHMIVEFIIRNKITQMKISTITRQEPRIGTKRTHTRITFQIHSQEVYFQSAMILQSIMILRNMIAPLMTNISSQINFIIRSLISYAPMLAKTMKALHLRWVSFACHSYLEVEYKFDCETLL